MYMHLKPLLIGLALVSTTECQKPYDYVIVGGGTCGLTVANRLSENPNVTVAVIESGVLQEGNENVTSWDSFTKAFFSSIDWQYPSAKQQYAADQELVYHAGKALGGTSTINGMTYIRAEKAQIDAWAAVGNQGWNWSDLYNYYKKSEHFDSATQNQLDTDGVSYISEYHGFDGPLHVGYPVELNNGSFHETANATVQALGIPFNPDVNGGHVRGFTVWQSTFDRVANVRADAAREYYLPARSRPNLHVFASTRANKMIWNPSGASASVNGVEVTLANNHTTVVGVNKEVIVSAGSLRSPAFLELSGIGNPKILGKYGIQVKVALDAVGENLQDQTNVAFNATGNLNFTGTGPYVAFANLSDFLGQHPSSVVDSSVKSWAQKVSAANSGYVNATALEKLFQIQYDLLFKTLVPDAEIIVSGTANYIFIAYWGLMPFSRGSVHITSADPSDVPLIDPRYFVADIDLTIQTAISRLARSIFYTKPMSDIILEENIPGLSSVPLNATDAEWATFLKGAAMPNYHPISSASMMSQELGGVVDSSLKVYGTDNVRVIDASVLPFQVSGHLTSTLYALSEKAADIIKASMS